MKPTLLLLLGFTVLSASVAPIPSREAAAGEVVELPPVLDGDSRWGINHTYPTLSAIRLARDAGARWNRWEFRWADIEPTPGRLQFGDRDVLVTASLANGMAVQGILISTPDWAADPQTRLPSGLYLPWSDPRNFWGRFAREMAAHYRGRIRHWEIWNEPDLAEIFWAGSTADYYQLLKVAYQAIKSVDPSAQIILAGLAYWPNPGFLDDLLRLMAADPSGRANNHFFDVLAWHTYSRPSDLWDRVTQSRQQLATSVGVRPIWVNETNVPAWDESSLNDFRPYAWSATIQEQASYLIQALAYGAAAGAERIFIYRLQDTEWPEAYGLVRDVGTARPAYAAFQVAARYLSHASSGTVARQGGVEQVILRRSDQRVSVIWNRTPNRLTARVGALASTATLVDQSGAARTVRPGAGQYQLDLAPATANNGVDAADYIVGGPPLIMVESLPAKSQTAQESSPLIGYSGAWDLVRAEGPRGGGVRRTDNAGLGAAIEFEGPTVTWFTSKGPDRGLVRIEVDGSLQGEIDLYSPTVVWDVPLIFGDFSPGPHRLTVIALGQRSIAATGAFVDVDAFAAESLRTAPSPPIFTPSPTPTATIVATPTPSPTVTPTATPTPTAPPTSQPTEAPGSEPARSSRSLAAAAAALAAEGPGAARSGHQASRRARDSGP